MPRTILIVDDNAIDRTVLTGLLEQNYNVITAENVTEMIDALRLKGKTLSAVLLDIVMPGTDGFEALRKIRDSAVYRQVPVIVTTAHTDEDTQVRALSLGAAGFAFKPFNREILLHLLENTINLREKSALANTFSIDPLTGLLNRRTFFQHAAEMIRGREPGYYILACLDIENFKVVNDQNGLDTGDRLIKQIADNINKAMASVGGICCHDAADKFGLLYPAAMADSDAVSKLHEGMAATDIIGRRVKIRVGRYSVRNLAVPVSAMYDRATIAQESIKGRYDICIAEYTEQMRQNLLNEQQVVTDMDHALAAGEFEPWFQPQYDHTNGALIGAEALVRWRKGANVVSPDNFIPIFERNGFIYEVDQYIWREVCILLRRWLDEGRNPMPVSVNISRYDLYQKDFVGKLCALIEEYSLPVDLLRLEVTESAFTDTTNTIFNVVNELIKKGFTVEIDDFGSGYSSLNTLKDVPAAILKLDMRFFEKTGDAKRGGNIVESVVRMAKWLGMSVIAEGVEDKAQADYLKSIGCCYIQGFYYARPMPAAEYEKRLDSDSKEAELSRMQTLQTLDNNDFWDSHSMDTLIFNSYVGAACILEYSEGKVEVLRTTDNFVNILGGEGLSIQDVLDVDWTAHMDEHGAAMFSGAVTESIETREPVTGEYEFHDLPGCPETVILRCSLRVIATAGARALIYCLNDNITAQRMAEREAFNATQRMSAVLNNSHCGITAAVVHENGEAEHIFVNDRFYEILGYTREQFAAEVKNPYDIVVPEDRERILSITAKRSATSGAISVEMRAMRRDGSPVWLRCDTSIVSFADVSGPVQLSSFLDITEQKENEMKQLESARQLQIIMGNVNGGVSAIQIFDDATSRFVFNNERYFELYGYTRQQAEEEHLDVMTLILPEDLPSVMEKVKKLKADRQPTIIDYRIRKRDGSLALLRVNASLMNIAGCDGDVITSVITDITEKKATEDKLSAIVANINGGISAIYLHDESPEFAIANDQYYRLFGYTKEQFESEVANAFDLIHPEDRERVKAHYRETSRDGDRFSIEYRIIRRDGAVRDILSNTSVIRLFGIGGPVQLSVSNDITDLRNVQRKERKAAEQLRFLNDSARAILAQPDSEQAICDTLSKLLAYFAAERSYVVELNYADMTSCNTYEVCADGTTPEMGNLQAIPFDRDDFWYDTLKTGGFLSIDDVSALDKSKARIRDLLRAQGIRSIVLAPLLRDGLLLGFVGVDNPANATGQVARITALSDYISVLLTRRDLMRKISHDTDAITKLPMQLLDNLPSGAALYEYDGQSLTVIHINKSYWKLVERESVEYGKASVMGAIHPDDREAVRTEIDSAIREQRDAQVDIRLLCGESEFRPFRILANITQGENGKHLIYTSYTPISHERGLSFELDTLLNVIPSGVLKYAADEGNEIAYINRNFIEDLGYTQEQFREKFHNCFREMIYEGDRERVQAEICDKEDDGNIGKLDYRVEAADGQLRWFHDEGVKVTDEEGRSWYYVTLVDITQTHDAYAQLKLVTDSMPSGLATYICTGESIRVSYCNSDFCTLFGTTLEHYEKIVAADPFGFVFEEDCEGLRAQYARLVTDASPIDCVYRIHTKTGAIKWVHQRAVVARRSGDDLYVNSALFDVTEHQIAQEKLRISEEVNRLAIEHSGKIVTRFDVKARTLTLPELMTPIYQVPKLLENMPEEQIELGRISPETAHIYRDMFENIVSGSAYGTATYQQRSTKGWRWLEAQYTTVFSNQGMPISAVITFTDVSEQLEKEVVYNKWQQSLMERPKESYSLFRCNLSRNASFDSYEGELLMLGEIDDKRSFMDVTEDYAGSRVYAEDRQRYVAFMNSDTMLASYYRGYRSDSMEYRETDENGAVRWLRVNVDMVEYPNSKDIEVYLMFEDINDSKVAELQTRTQAETDPLTGILNRSTFIARMEQLIHAAGPDEKHALFMLDIDNFKQVNDTLGHGAGDQVLRELTHKIAGILRHDDLIGRMGGDEFFVFIKDIPDRTTAARKAEQICSLRIMPDGADSAVTASIGIAMIPLDGEDFDTLYKKVDATLYRRKRQGKNGYLFVE